MTEVKGIVASSATIDWLESGVSSLATHATMNTTMMDDVSYAIRAVRFQLKKFWPLVSKGLEPRRNDRR